MICLHDGREIELRLHGDMDDIQVSEAYYLDGDEDVPDDVIDMLLDKYADEVYMELYENKIGQAEDYYEGDR